jgi:protein-tyrosine phosphatase
VQVLFVCSGNICRSPLGAQLLAARLGPDRAVSGGGSFEIVSAGTIAQDGVAMDEQAAAQSLRLGGDPSAHRSRYLTEQIVAGADLVLTAERAHRSAVVQLVPRANRKAFTIRQFARVLDGLEPSDLDGVSTPEELVAVVSRLKGVVPPPERPEDDDVEDPYRRSDATHERVATAIDAAVSRTAEAFRAL